MSFRKSQELRPKKSLRIQEDILSSFYFYGAGQNDGVLPCLLIIGHKID